MRIASKCSCWKSGESESLFRRRDSFISQICGYHCYTAPGQPCTRDFCNKPIQQSPKHLTTYSSLCYFKMYQCIESWLVMCMPGTVQHGDVQSSTVQTEQCAAQFFDQLDLRLSQGSALSQGSGLPGSPIHCYTLHNCHQYTAR